MFDYGTWDFAWWVGVEGMCLWGTWPGLRVLFEA